MCDFLLVSHCNYMPIYYRFRDNDVLVEKMRLSPFFACRLKHWQRGSLGICGMKVGSNKRDSLRYPNLIILRLLDLTQCQRVSDERTDRLWSSIEGDNKIISSPVERSAAERGTRKRRRTKTNVSCMLLHGGLYELHTTHWWLELTHFNYNNYTSALLRITTAV